MSASISGYGVFVNTGGMDWDCLYTASAYATYTQTRPAPRGASGERDLSAALADAAAWLKDILDDERNIIVGQSPVTVVTPNDLCGMVYYSGCRCVHVYRIFAIWSDGTITS